MKYFRFVQNHHFFSPKYLNKGKYNKDRSEFDALRQSLKEWLEQANFDDPASAVYSFINPVLDTLQFAHSPVDELHK